MEGCIIAVVACMVPVPSMRGAEEIELIGFFLGSHHHTIEHTLSLVPTSYYFIRRLDHPPYVTLDWSD